jgi:hypothetical protein
MSEKRYIELFFLDEAGVCRRERFNAFKEAGRATEVKPGSRLPTKWNANCTRRESATEVKKLLGTEMGSLLDGRFVRSYGHAYLVHCCYGLRKAMRKERSFIRIWARRY